MMDGAVLDAIADESAFIEPRAEDIHGIGERVSPLLATESAQSPGLFMKDW
jgi:hypothetical protein